MARLRIDGEDLVVDLPPAQKFWAFHGNVRVPLSTVRAVDVPDNPWLALRGWRMAGVGLSGVAALGTRRHGTGRDFVAVRGKDDAVRVHLSTGPYEQLLVSVPDAERTADEIAAAAGIHR